MKRLAQSVLLVSLTLSSAAFAGSADDIDQLFEKASNAERGGDCAGAADAYSQIEVLAQSLPEADKTQVLSQTKSRQTRKKACIDACTLSAKEKTMFETVKKAKSASEHKRVGEMCKQLLHAKNAKCSTYDEIRAACPSLEGTGDPCTNVSSETKAELERLDSEVNGLQSKVAGAEKAAKGGSARALDNVMSLNRELENAGDRLFDLREKYFNCDKVYGQLKDKVGTVGQSRAALRAAAAQGVKTGLGRMGTALADMKKANAELSKSNVEMGQKIEALTTLTNDLALDIIGMAQADSVAMTVKVEGAKEAADQLPKVLAGDREAMDTIIKKHPEYFQDGAGRAGLVKKKESLERLDKVMTKLAEQGHGERLGFKKAQQELSASLSLVKSAIPPETDQKHATAGNIPWTSIGIFLGFALGMFLVIMMMRRGGQKSEARGFSLTPAPSAALAMGVPDLEPAREEDKPKRSFFRRAEKTEGRLDLSALSPKSIPVRKPIAEKPMKAEKPAKPSKVSGRLDLSSLSAKPMPRKVLAPKLEDEATEVSAQAAEAALMVKAEADAKARVEAELKADAATAREIAARVEAATRVREAAEAKAREEAEAKAREEAAAAAQAKADAEALARAEAEAQARAEAKEAAERADAEAKAQADAELAQLASKAPELPKQEPTAVKPKPKYNNPVPTFGFAKKK